MATLEQVEKLREKANVSFEEAKAALDACNGDLLDALIYLERQGRVNAPAGGGYYSSQNTQEETHTYTEGSGHQQYNHGGGFKDMMVKFGHFCARVFRIGNTNFLVAEKNGNVMFECPVTALVLLLIFFFWVVVPLFVISLFFGFRYRFRGHEIGTEQVNKVMNDVTGTVEDVKKNFTNDKQQ